MAAEDAKDKDTGETTTEVDSSTEETDAGTADDEDSWNRLSDLVGKVVEEKLSSWSGPQQKAVVKKTISQPSPRKRETPARKQGFLSGQFFSGLKSGE